MYADNCLCNQVLCSIKRCYLVRLCWNWNDTDVSDVTQSLINQWLNNKYHFLVVSASRKQFFLFLNLHGYESYFHSAIFVFFFSFSFIKSSIFYWSMFIISLNYLLFFIFISLFYSWFSIQLDIFILSIKILYYCFNTFW